MIDLDPHRAALAERISVIESLIDETHPQPPNVGPISREARGLAIVLLFASYENLLTSLTRTLLETALQLRVGNRRLQPGFQAFAIHNTVISAKNLSEKKLFTKALPALIETATLGGRGCTIDPNIFPNDGSFMKSSQIIAWCALFKTGEPAALLQNIWNSIDSVVTQRNGVAHGRLTPQDVGRGYTESEIRTLISNWSKDWDNFLLHVANLASSRDFFRTPR